MPSARGHARRRMESRYTKSATDPAIVTALTIRPALNPCQMAKLTGVGVPVTEADANPTGMPARIGNIPDDQPNTAEDERTEP